MVAVANHKAGRSNGAAGRVVLGNVILADHLLLMHPAECLRAQEIERVA